MAKHYYAASLKGTNPRAIENVFSFEYYSQRKQWLTEKHFPEGERISLRAGIAKKHLMLPVTYREAMRLGSKCWTWFYNDCPDWLS
jgi:hypothetical protein